MASEAPQRVYVIVGLALGAALLGAVLVTVLASTLSSGATAASCGACRAGRTPAPETGRQILPAGTSKTDGRVTAAAVLAPPGSGRFGAAASREEAVQAQRLETALEEAEEGDVVEACGLFTVRTPAAAAAGNWGGVAQ